MAYTTDFDEELMTAEEQQLMKTKQAILEKLRVRFGEIANHKSWVPTHNAETKEQMTSGSH